LISVRLHASNSFTHSKLLYVRAILQPISKKL
jgi:hypothetical protein